MASEESESPPGKSRNRIAELCAHVHADGSLLQFLRDIATEEERTGLRDLHKLREVVCSCAHQVRTQCRAVSEGVINDDRLLLLIEVIVHAERARLIVSHLSEDIVIDGFQFVKLARVGCPLVKYGDVLILRFHVFECL